MRADSGKKEDDINALYGPTIQIIYKFFKFLYYKYYWTLYTAHCYWHATAEKGKLLLLFILNVG